MRHILSSQPCCSHVASPEASSLPDLLKFRIRGNVKCFTEHSHSGHWLQMQTPGPSPGNILNLSDWGLGPGFGIYNNCPHLTLMQSNTLESVSVDTGSPFYGETTHEKTESIVCRNPENLPPGNILSAACKTPQAVQVDSMEKDSPDGIWILEPGRVQTPFPKEWLLQQRAEREVSNAATATIMFQAERCCPSV